MYCIAGKNLKTLRNNENFVEDFIVCLKHSSMQPTSSNLFKNFWKQFAEFVFNYVTSKKRITIVESNSLWLCCKFRDAFYMTSHNFPLIFITLRLTLHLVARAHMCHKHEMVKMNTYRTHTQNLLSFVSRCITHNNKPVIDVSLEVEWGLPWCWYERTSERIF